MGIGHSHRTKPTLKPGYAPYPEPLTTSYIEKDIMGEFKNIDNLLNTVKSRIDAHLKFKKEYDKLLAFDFSLFQFFGMGENKISKILAYFLDENQNHGQGNVFLNEFIKTVCEKEIEIKQSEIVCEKTITNKRRIDIYIKLDELTIAIENKIWADDQNNQLTDYSAFLEQEKGDYLLLYLNPYGREPKPKSIESNLKKRLLDENHLKVIGYKQDIIPLINNWLLICEADNISHFLKEFKNYLEVKFLGKNTLNMSKELRDVIFKNEEAVKELVDEYRKIENEIIDKLNNVGKELDKINPDIDSGIKKSKSELFNSEGNRVYKYSISKNNNKIWVRFEQNKINLFLTYYLQEGTDNLFEDILTESGITTPKKIDRKQSKSELIDLFLHWVEIANSSFRKYEERMNND